MLDLENSPETANDETPETAATPANEAPRLTLADLLKDPEPETAKGNGEAGESQQKAEPPKGGKPKTLKDLAETLKFQDKDLYAIEVPMSDGKSMTLGQLKDAAAKQDDLTARELAFEERRAKTEADWTRANTELRALISALPPKALSDQAIAMVRQKAEAEARIERDATMQAIPEWADQTRRETELQGMTELLKDYGFPPNFLQASFSSKLIRFVRDSYLRKQRIEQALAKVQEVKRPGTGKSSPHGAAKRPGSAKPGTNSKGPEARLMALLD